MCFNNLCLYVFSGAILVFLPGYEDIINLRDKILEDKKFADCNRYTSLSAVYITQLLIFLW